MPKKIINESIETVLGRFNSILRQSDVIDLCKLIASPFSSWPHYRAGLIDVRGKILRMPKDSKEKILMQPFLIMLLDMKKNLYPVFQNSEYGSYLRALGRVELRDKKVFEGYDTVGLTPLAMSPAEDPSNPDVPFLDKVKKFTIDDDLFMSVDPGSPDFSKFPEDIKEKIVKENLDYFYIMDAKKNVKKIKGSNIIW